MLGFVRRAYPGAALTRGTMILTGTPSGVAIQTPRWLVRASALAGVSRMKKLSIKLGQESSAFLSPGDEVTVDAAQLGRVSVRIGVASDTTAALAH